VNDGGGGSEGGGGVPAKTTAEIDLTDLPTVSAYVPGEKDYDPTKSREDTRTFLAVSFAVLLGIVVIGSGIILALWPDRVEVFEKYLTMVFAPLLGLVGTVSGFYFGEKSAEKKQGR
jgi:hypothetical protein